MRMPTMTLSDVAPEMLQALNDEVAAATQNSATYTLDGGRTTVLGEDTSFVEFPSTDIERIDEGQEVTLQVGSASYDAEVVDVRRTEIVLFVRGRASVDGHRCKLKVDDSSLVRALRTRLDRVQGGEVGDFSAARADELLSSPVTAAAADFPSDVLNTSQRSAVSSALTPGITYLWGPPGTGKTTTVAHVVAAMAEAGQSVLIVSNTNAAVDLALRRTAERIAAVGALEPGRVLRYGRGVASVSTFRDGILTTDGALAARGVRHRDLLIDLQREIDRAKVARAGIDKGRDGRQVGGWDQRRVALEDVLGGLREQLGDLESALVREAQILGTTAHCAATGRLDRTFDAVVIDEASMVSLPTAWLCLGLAKSHALVAGDFRQLAPISRAESGTALRMLRRSLFERLQQAHPDRSVADLPGLVTLTEQHRMTDEIAEMIGRVFYPEIHLSTGLAVGRRESLAVFPELPPLAGIEFISPRSIYGSGGTQFNPASAQVFAGMIESAIAKGFELSRTNLLAMSPYRAQSSLLQKIAAEFTDTRVTVEPIGSTVHRAQGDEAATIYFDLTESQRGGRIGRWYQGEGLAQDTSRLINVALSRAKDQIVVLGDRYHPKPGHPTLIILDHPSCICVLHSATQAQAVNPQLTLAL